MDLPLQWWKNGGDWLRGNHSTLIRQRCDSILQWRMKLTFINSERWLQNVMCTQGLSLIVVVLFSIYTEIETLFSFISIIKMITVCDRRYLEKPIHIVCWACMSLIQCGKVLLLALEYDSLLDNTKVQRSNRKALFFKYFQVRQSHCVNRPLYCEHHWSLDSIQRSVRRDQWWTACNYKAS